MYDYRKKMLAKRVASHISMNPHIDRKKFEDALKEVEEMEKVFGIPHPPDVLLDCIVDACAASMISQAFRAKYNLGTVENLRLFAFQSVISPLINTKCHHKCQHCGNKGHGNNKQYLNSNNICKTCANSGVVSVNR